MKKKDKVLTKSDIKWLLKEISKLFDKSLKKSNILTSKEFKETIDPKFEAIFNFIARVEAKIDAQSRMLYFIAKNRLSKKELREMAMISKTIRGEEKLKN